MTMIYFRKPENIFKSNCVTCTLCILVPSLFHFSYYVIWGHTSRNEKQWNFEILASCLSNYDKNIRPIFRTLYHLHYFDLIFITENPIILTQWKVYFYESQLCSPLLLSLWGNIIVNEICIVIQILKFVRSVLLPMQWLCILSIWCSLDPFYFVDHLISLHNCLFIVFRNSRAKWD